MLDPVTMTMKVQQAGVIGALCMAGAVGATWARLIRSEAAMLAGLPHRRADEQHTMTPLLALGARWTDHYGRRSHDVDVEHLR